MHSHEPHELGGSSTDAQPRAPRDRVWTAWRSGICSNRRALDPAATSLVGGGEECTGWATMVRGHHVCKTIMHQFHPLDVVLREGGRPQRKAEWLGRLASGRERDKGEQERKRGMERERGGGGDNYERRFDREERWREEEETTIEEDWIGRSGGLAADR